MITELIKVGLFASVTVGLVVAICDYLVDQFKRKQQQRKMSKMDSQEKYFYQKRNKIKL